MRKIRTVKKLPNDCCCVDEYELPFKFSGTNLYIYEPGINCYGDAVWYRWALNSQSSLAKKLLYEHQGKLHHGNQ